MPLFPMNFRRISFDEANPYLTGFDKSQDLIGKLYENVANMIKNQYLPSNLQSQIDEMKARTAQQYADVPLKQAQANLLGKQVEWFDPKAQASIDLERAQAHRENELANLPFGGQTLSGAAGQIAGLETIRKMYGENSPQYQQAQKAFELDQASKQSALNYRDALSSSMSTRYLTPTGKSIVEQARVQQGLSPSTGNENLTLPENGSKLAQQYDLLRQKQTTDAQARNRNLYATNIEKTLDLIDPDALTRFSGAAGGLEKAINKKLAPFSQESKAYDDYIKNLSKINFLATQVRQFYGDSVQPQMQEKLNLLLNPDSWRSNPRLAKETFKEVENILRNETKTYRDALQSRAAYLGINQKPTRVNNDNVSDVDPFGIK